MTVPGLQRGVFSLLVAASLTVAFGLLVTGAFHHDGLADIADAFGGGWTVEQRFEILRDSRLGTYGTSALTMALLVEVASLSSLGVLADNTPGVWVFSLVSAIRLGAVGGNGPLGWVFCVATGWAF